MPQIPVVSIIDDDASVRDATVDLVSSLGLTALAFPSAEDFLHSSRAKDTACVISDMQMPGMKGHELQRQLLAQGRRIPIIFITAFPEKATRERVEAAGALGYLEKPFDAAILADLLQHALLH